MRERTVSKELWGKYYKLRSSAFINNRYNGSSNVSKMEKKTPKNNISTGIKLNWKKAVSAHINNV